VAHEQDDDRDGTDGSTSGGDDGHTDTAELPTMAGGLGEGTDALGLLEDPAALDDDGQDGGADEDAEARSPLFDEVRAVLTGEPELTLGEVAEQAGLPVQILREVFAATDWENRPAYDQRDVDYARAVAQLLDIVPLSAMVRTVRTRYRAVTSIVVSDLGTVRDHVLGPAHRGGADLQQLAGSLAEAAERILPLSTSQLSEDYRHALLRLLDSDALARGAQLEGGRELDLAVGFVDIVGYTALSGRVDPVGLDHVLVGFEDLVASVVSGQDDVLLAKFVGDAAMLVASDPRPLASTLLELVDDHTRLAEAPRRAGMSAGLVLVREGDYFGSIPNLAARLTDHANPWSLLADQELEERLEGDFDLEKVSKTKIRGVGDQRPLRVRRKEGARS
jgi:adenylate cyclase